MKTRLLCGGQSPVKAILSDIHGNLEALQAVLNVGSVGHPRGDDCPG
jgi:hypothetical protein